MRAEHESTKLSMMIRQNCHARCMGFMCYTHPKNHDCVLVFIFLFAPPTHCLKTKIHDLFILQAS